MAIPVQLHVSSKSQTRIIASILVWALSLVGCAHTGIGSMNGPLGESAESPPVALCAEAKTGDTLLEGQTLMINASDADIVIDSVELVESDGIEIIGAYVFDPTAAGMVGLLIDGVDGLEPALAATLEPVGHDEAPVIEPGSERAVLVELAVLREDAGYGRIRVEYTAGGRSYGLLGPTQLRTAERCG